MDLSNFSLEQLRELSAQVASTIKNQEQTAITEARQQILAIAQSVGLPLNEFMAKSSTQKTSKKERAVAFRHPEDKNMEWSGLGRKPHWVKNWVDAGGSMDDLRV